MAKNFRDFKSTDVGFRVTLGLGAKAGLTLHRVHVPSRVDSTGRISG